MKSLMTSVSIFALLFLPYSAIASTQHSTKVGAVSAYQVADTDAETTDENDQAKSTDATTDGTDDAAKVKDAKDKAKTDGNGTDNND